AQRRPPSAAPTAQRRANCPASRQLPSVVPTSPCRLRHAAQRRAAALLESSGALRARIDRRASARPESERAKPGSMVLSSSCGEGPQGDVADGGDFWVVVSRPDSPPHSTVNVTRELAPLWSRTTSSWRPR